MTWTKLFHIKSLPNAMKRVIPGRPLEQLPITKRYQAEIKKQFRLNGVPWLYDAMPKKEHHRDRKPKISKRSIEKEERLQKIQKNLAESEKKMLEFRQDKIDSRPLGGIDKIISKTLPSYIKGDVEDLPDYIKRRREGKPEKKEE